MTGSSEYVALPEGLTPEQAEAYRAGYERARRGVEPTVPVERPLPADAPREQRSSRPAGAPSAPTPDRTSSYWPFSTPSERPDEGADADGHQDGTEPARPPVVGRAPAAAAGERPRRRPDRQGEDSSRGRRTAVWVAVAALVSLVLVAGAFAVGRVVSDDATDRNLAEQSTGSGGPGSSGGERGAAERAPYRGPVDVVTVASASASCQAGDSVDAAGNPVSYPPASAADADLSTAWRCDGAGVGQTLTLELPEGTRVAEVGLVPGYAKTDPATGEDRYAENNRITRVRWTFAGGASYVQRIGGGAEDRSMRTIRVPATRTGTVTMEVLASDPGPRNTIAVSEVRVAAAG